MTTIVEEEQSDTSRVCDTIPYGTICKPMKQPNVSYTTEKQLYSQLDQHEKMLLTGSTTQNNNNNFYITNTASSLKQLDRLD